MSLQGWYPLALSRDIAAGTSATAPSAAATGFGEGEEASCGFSVRNLHQTLGRRCPINDGSCCLQVLDRHGLRVSNNNLFTDSCRQRAGDVEARIRPADDWPHFTVRNPVQRRGIDGQFGHFRLKLESVGTGTHVFPLEMNGRRTETTAFRPNSHYFSTVF